MKVREPWPPSPFLSQAKVFHCFLFSSSTSSPCWAMHSGCGTGICSQSITVSSAPSSLHSSFTPAWVLPWAAVLQDEPAAAWALHGLQFPSVNIHLLHCGSSMGYSVDSAPPQLQGRLLQLFLSSFPNFGAHRALFQIFSHHSSLPCSALPFLTHSFPEAPAWLRAQLCLQWVTEAGWSQQCPAWGSPGLSSQRIPISKLN